ncbi:germination protein YpeB [Desulfofundulus sp.]|uniref:germination protein YpeB n=1 Tax=Desulfofundulus sp. TaxID=2282750 RepID=UPI003C710E6D
MDRKRLWILSLAAGVLIAGALGYWGYQQYTVRQRLETALSNKYYRALYDLTDNVQNMEVLLSKSLVAGTPEAQSTIFMELWQRAMAAQANLNQLPVTDAVTGRTAKFLTQVGDYAHSLLQRTAGGEPATDQQWETLNRLYRQSADLNLALHDMERRIADGRLYLNELVREGGRTLSRQGPRLANANFQEIEKHMETFPTLIYDGPFSEHLEKATPRGLTGKNISTEEARRRALAMVEGRGGYAVERVGEVRGKIPSYVVELRPQSGNKGGKVTVAITRQGGHLNWMTCDRRVGNPALSIDRARQKALDYLNSLGFKNMVPVYYEHQNGLAIFNFAATQERVILYPDQVKVTVAMDNGQILGVEASNYLMNHTSRELPRPRISVEEARQKLNPRLKEVKGGRLALIPEPPDREKLTYEFQGLLDKDLFLIYIDALDGSEARVLRVVRNPEGVLTL